MMERMDKPEVIYKLDLEKRIDLCSREKSLRANLPATITAPLVKSSGERGVEPGGREPS